MFKKNGTIILSHNQDYNDAQRLFNIIHQNASEVGCDKYTIYPAKRLSDFESSLDKNKFGNSFMQIPDEANIDPHIFFKESNKYINQNDNIQYVSKEIKSIQSSFNLQKTLVIDARGIGSKHDSHRNIFGIRGEALLVNAPDVNLKHSIRMVHPRHPIYITPRKNNHYYIGATTINSEDESPISIKSSLELMSSLYSLHEGFSEARVLKTYARARPSYISGLPKIENNNGVISINGFYRHGYLLAPYYCSELINNYLI